MNSSSPSRTLGISLFNNVQDNHPAFQQMTLQQVCDFLTPQSPPVVAKADRKQLYSLAVYKTGTTRKKENVEAMTGIVFDFDNKDADWLPIGEITRSLDRRHLIYFWHTTWSHTSNRPRWRLLIPFVTPCPPEKWETVYRYALALLGNPPGIDQAASKDMAHMWYSPCKAPDGPFAAQAKREGYLAHPDHLLPLFPPEEQEALSSESATIEEADTPPADCSLEEVADALGAISPDCGYETWIKISMALHHQFKGSGAAFDLWRRWSQGADTFPGEQTLRRYWNGFHEKNRAKKITIGTLFYLAKQKGWTQKTLPSSEEEGIADIVVRTITTPSFDFKGYEFADIYDLPSPFLKELYGYLLGRHPFEVPLYALGAAITMAGFLLRQHIKGATHLRTNFMILTVGGSGSGKTLMMQGLLDILEYADLGNLYASRLGSYQGAVERIDKNGGFLFLGQDEASYELKSMRNKNVGTAELRTEEFKLKVFSCPSSFPSDVIKSGEQIIIRYPFYSEFSVSTPEILDHFSADDITKGLLPRYLLFMAPQQFFPKNAHLRSEMSWNLRTALERFKTTPLSGCLSAYFDEEAQDYLDEFEACVQQCRKEAQARTPWDAFRYDAILARLPEHAKKLALLGAVRSETTNCFIMSLPAIAWGIAVALFSFRNMERVVDSRIHENQTEKNYARVLSIIKELSRGDWIRRRDLFQKTRFMTINALEEVLTRLKEEERIDIKSAPRKAYLIRYINKGDKNDRNT